MKPLDVNNRNGGDITIRAGNATGPFRVDKIKYETHGFDKDVVTGFNKCLKCGFTVYRADIYEFSSKDGNYSCNEFVIKDIIE